MEVVSPTPAVDFHFDSASTSPYITAPSSPQRFGPFFYSAPASPAFYRAAGSPSSVPFDWEDEPGLPKGHVSAPASDHGGDAAPAADDDFAFDFSGHLDPSPADELFAGGKIKPLKPPPGLRHDDGSSARSSPRSPKEIVRRAFSPRRGAKVGFDPFAAALERTRTEGARRNAEEKRGRTRSLASPYRVSDLLFEPEPEPAKSPASWYKRWRIKDLLLFRSASESRAKGDEKEELFGKFDSAKIPVVRRDDDDDVRNTSSRRRSGPSISAHEMHYTINRQLSEEMKKRTFLPYKQGLLGCLGFHPTVPDVSTKGIN